MTLFTPLMTYQGITYLIISRVIQGIFSGMAFPSVNAVYAVWSPPFEVSCLYFKLQCCYLKSQSIFLEVTKW